MGTMELKEKISNYRELQHLIEEAKAEMESISDEIKAEMTARETDELTVGEYKVRWSMVKSSRFDSKALKIANPELYGQFSKTTETRRFTVA